MDTNADPDVITVPIPGNDDAIRAVALITQALAETIAEARAQMPTREVAEDSDAETYSTDSGTEGDADADRKKRRARRKRRPKPEAIAARLKGEADAGEGDRASPARPPRLPRRTRTPSPTAAECSAPPLQASSRPGRRFHYPTR